MGAQGGSRIAQQKFKNRLTPCLRSDMATAQPRRAGCLSPHFEVGIRVPGHQRPNQRRTVSLGHRFSALPAGLHSNSLEPLISIQSESLLRSLSFNS